MATTPTSAEELWFLEPDKNLKGFQREVEFLNEESFIEVVDDDADKHE